MKTALITTTINVPHVLALYRKIAGPDVKFFIALDEKSDFKGLSQYGPVDSANCWLTPDFQRALNYRCSELIGWNCVQRRNIALLEALQCALTLNASGLQVYSDSQVVVRQMRGEYVCRSPRLYSLHWICRKLARTLSFSIHHVSRENNLEANRLANAGARRLNS